MIATTRIILEVPFVVRRRGGRRHIVCPEGAMPYVPSRSQVDTTLVKALGRAFRWRKLLETGVYDSIGDIARAEKINTSYVSRVLRLTLLAPDLIEEILGGSQSESISLGILSKPLPVLWADQRGSLHGNRPVR
jgi:hypothetical protein